MAQKNSKGSTSTLAQSSKSKKSKTKGKANKKAKAKAASKDEYTDSLGAEAAHSVHRDFIKSKLDTLNSFETGNNDHLVDHIGQHTDLTTAHTDGTDATDATDDLGEWADKHAGNHADVTN